MRLSVMHACITDYLHLLKNKWNRTNSKHILPKKLNTLIYDPKNTTYMDILALDKLNINFSYITNKNKYIILFNEQENVVE